MFENRMRKIGAWNQESEILSVIQTHEAQKDPGHITTQQESAAFQATNIPLPSFAFHIFSCFSPSHSCSIPFLCTYKTQHPSSNRQQQPSRSAPKSMQTK